MACIFRKKQQICLLCVFSCVSAFVCRIMCVTKQQQQHQQQKCINCIENTINSSCHIFGLRFVIINVHIRLLYCLSLSFNFPWIIKLSCFSFSWKRSSSLLKALYFTFFTIVTTTSTISFFIDIFLLNNKLLIIIG